MCGLWDLLSEVRGMIQKLCFWFLMKEKKKKKRDRMKDREEYNLPRLKEMKKGKE